MSTNAVMFRVNIQNVLSRLQRKLSVACKVVPFTDRVVSHFLVQSVPFLLDTLAQLFHVDDPVMLACTHTLVGSPHRVVDGVQIRLFGGRVLIVSGLRAMRGRPLPEQRSPLPVASILLSRPTVFSERELTFTFAICYRPSVCLSSVCNVRAPYSGH